MANKDGWEPVPVDEQGWEPVPDSESEVPVATEEESYQVGSEPSETNPALIDRVPAGAREFLRSIGTGEDAADAYMRGLNNPSKSETMQEGAIRGSNETIDKMGVGKLPEGVQTTVRFVGGFIPSAAGLATDIATNPKELLMIATMSKLPTLFKQVAPELSQRIASFATKERTLSSVAKDTGKAIKGAFTPKIVKPGVGDVIDMRQEIAQSAQDASTLLAGEKRVEIANLDSKYSTISNGLDAKLKILDGKIEAPEGVTNIPTVADKATTTLRNKYWDYAKDLYERYGVDYQKAIAGEKMSTQKAYDATRATLQRTGMLGRPESTWSTAEKSIYKYSQELEAKLPGIESRTEVAMTPQGPQRVVVKTGQETINVSDFDKQVQSILKAGKGKQYGEGEHIFTTFKQEVANAIGDVSPKIKALRIKFAPELQTKHELNKIVQPFNRSGDKDTTAGINFFSKYVEGKMTNPDELRVLRDIQSNPHLGGDIVKPLDNMKLQRNTILRNQLNLEIEKPSVYQKVDEKYAGLTDTLRKDLRMQNEVTKAMMEDAIQSQNISDRIKKVVGGVAVTTIAGVGAKKFGLF